MTGKYNNDRNTFLCYNELMSKKKHTPNTRSHSWTFLVAGVLLGFGVSSSAPILLAQVGQRREVHSREVELHAVRHVPTCEEVGLCQQEQRLILGTDNARTVQRLVGRGCTRKHDLRGSFSVSCPKNLSLLQVRPERAFRMQDLPSNAQMHVDQVHGLGVSGAGVRIAVLDTGADVLHPELVGRMAAYVNFTDEDATDGHGHGTHVSGIALGQGVKPIDDGGAVNRVLGVAPDAELLVGKICYNGGWCLEGDIVAGIEWAVMQGADVINLSLGGGAFLNHCDGDPLAAIVNWAVDQGVVVAAAAGNGGMHGEGVAVPACASKVLAVAAVDSHDVWQPWSSYGLPIDIAAPGVGILSSLPCETAGTCPDAGYGKWSGTSMATPHVTGVAALLHSIDDTLTPADVYNILTSTAQDIDASGFDMRTGFGRVDAKAAIDILLHQSSSSSLSSSSESSFSSSSSSSSESSSREGQSEEGEKLDDNKAESRDAELRVRAEVAVRISHQVHAEALVQIRLKIENGFLFLDEGKMLLEEGERLLEQASDALLHEEYDSAWSFANTAKHNFQQAMRGKNFVKIERHNAADDDMGQDRGNAENSREQGSGHGQGSDGVRGFLKRLFKGMLLDW
ncbi:hypothetical protein COU77_03385 [Candidatus Peregrinibacteria bacterium CG10_big_fil_rev_8_21_14_0_10_49_16]|nr:MAG: hypothetical protein COW95_04035 [Candidatus Peregrinibacteria bacterium CG22_combo_CG10-13_8_21_14_all_49_11]PIR51874.1 MAG: hypothetical protein COU77_03385 [Candidatus Peregrinibacteria bacterium CG10_big_fil_rev_8_21_14_0_10_49_16]